MSRYLNLACGATRPPEPWINLDNLSAVLKPGSPEADNLLKETNYVDWNLSHGELPFRANSLSVIMASHVIEHFDCVRGMEIIKDCRRILEPGGTLCVSVPDAEYFRQVYNEDNIQNAVPLFGEPIYEPDGETTFFGYALWNRYHKAILNYNSLWCYFMRAGFKSNEVFKLGHGLPPHHEVIVPLLNRLKFSLVMFAVKE